LSCGVISPPYQRNQYEMELIGRIKLIRDEQTFPSGFTKREFVLTTEEQYPNDIQFELLKEKGSMITSFREGDRLKVQFDIRGREWQGKYFNSLVAWKIESADATASSSSASAPPPPPIPEAMSGPMDDDLPF
jgi:single-strand DNA-binding protein